MGRVASGFSMSLDGFIAGPGDDVRQVFSWYFSGDTEFRFPGVGDRWAMKVSKASAQVLQEAVDAAGALVTGRRQFDNTNGWDGCHPANVPVFVVSHRPAPAEWLKAHPNAPFTFVPEGVEAAIARAQKVAGDKTVIVDGASIVHQAIRAGLVDEVAIDLVPVLLGQGVRYFDETGPTPIRLEHIRTVEGAGVTHLQFRVVK